MGDYPADATNFDPENLEFHYASELNEFIGEHFKGQFCLSGHVIQRHIRKLMGLRKRFRSIKEESRCRSRIFSNTDFL